MMNQKMSATALAFVLAGHPLFLEECPSTYFYSPQWNRRCEILAENPHTDVEKADGDPKFAQTLAAQGGAGRNTDAPLIDRSAMEAANMVAIRAHYDRLHQV